MTKIKPYLDEAMRAWIIKTAYKNHWRVSNWCEVEDLIQDGYLCFAKCADAYPDIWDMRRRPSENRKHFMALVQRAYIRHIIDLSNSRTQSPLEVTVTDLAPNADQFKVWDTLSPRVESDAMFGILLEQAPNEFKALLTLLVSEVARDIGYRRKDGIRETTNAHYCRLLGFDPDEVDIPAIVRKYLAPH